MDTAILWVLMEFGPVMADYLETFIPPTFNKPIKPDTDDELAWFEYEVRFDLYIEKKKKWKEDLPKLLQMLTDYVEQNKGNDGCALWLIILIEDAIKNETEDEDEVPETKVIQQEDSPKDEVFTKASDQDTVLIKQQEVTSTEEIIKTKSMSQAAINHGIKALSSYRSEIPKPRKRTTRGTQEPSKTLGYPICFVMDTDTIGTDFGVNQALKIWSYHGRSKSRKKKRKLTTNQDDRSGNDK